MKHLQLLVRSPEESQVIPTEYPNPRSRQPEGEERQDVRDGGQGKEVELGTRRHEGG